MKPNNNKFEILKKKISETLAPALLNKMNELGYARCMYIDDNGAELGLNISSVLLAISKPDKFFMPYPEPYDSAEGLEDKKHRVIIKEFKFMQQALIALTKRQQEVEEASRWIDNIGTVYERKVIIEKVK
jgi:hypothetical protein